MGHGSSARPHPKGTTTTEVMTFGGSPVEACVDEAVWLRRVIEKEKAEKLWLMSRFECVERELLARSEEAAQLRAQLSGMATGTSPSQSQSHEASSPLRQAAANSPSMNVPSPVFQGAPTSPTLKERRGLRLSVQTNRDPATSAVSAVKAKPADNVASSLEMTTGLDVDVTPWRPEEKALAQPLDHRQSRSEAFLATLNSQDSDGVYRGNLVEPMTATATIGRNTNTWLEEPMSPLLKRRIAAKGGVSEEFVEGRRRPRPGGLNGTAARSRSNTETSLLSRSEALSVSTPKIFKMDDEVPQTPKRVPMTPATARKRNEEIWTMAIEENDDAEA